MATGKLQLRDHLISISVKSSKPSIRLPTLPPNSVIRSQAV